MNSTNKSEQRIKVLFVCLGNICRSPMAEAVFRKMVEQEQLQESVEIDSAGTGNWHVGEPPHHGTRKKLEEKGISTAGLYCRQLTLNDGDDFDYIIGMDQQNVKDIRNLLNKPDDPKIMRFLDITDTPKDVPDPYFTGDFQETYELVEKGCRSLLQLIQKKIDNKEILL